MKRQDTKLKSLPRAKSWARLRSGFTLVELSLSMVFISILLVAVATLTIHVSNIYQKGLSIRAVNALGRELIDSISLSVSASPILENVNPPKPVGNGATNIDLAAIEAARAKYYSFNPDPSHPGAQASGVFCTGRETFIWNTANTITEARKGNTAHAILLSLDGGVPTAHKFARIPDSTRKFCQQDNTGRPAFRVIGDKPEDQLKASTVSDLIGDDENDLALYDFTVYPAVQSASTLQTLYSFSFILATIRGGINIDSANEYCTGKPRPFAPEESGNEYNDQDFNYCAINKFNFSAIQAGENKDINSYGSR